MDNLEIKSMTVESLTGPVMAWFLDTYFLAVEEEIQKGASKSWRCVDRTQKGDLEKIFKNLLSQSDQACLYIAFLNNNPIGYFLGIVKDCIAEIPAKVGYINGLYVDSLYRRKKIASQLYAKGLSWFQERGIFHYELYVALQSVEGRQFWAAKGFVPSEQVMNLSL